MNDLRTALELLQREVAAAVAMSGTQDGGCRVTVSSVNASIGLAWVRTTETASMEGAVSESGGGYQWQVVEPGTPANHTIQLSLQIQPGRGMSTGASEVPSATAVKPLDVPVAVNSIESNDLNTACAQVFGKPGFDNAARAEVYGDLASALDPQRLLEAVDKAGSGEEIPDSDPLHLEIRRLRRLLGYSPVGVRRASEILRDLIVRGQSGSLLGLLADRWNFGTHWEPPTRDAANP